MYDIHVGDFFMSKHADTLVKVIEIDLDGRVKYEFDKSGAKRWSDRDKFLTKYPISSGGTLPGNIDG